MTEKKYTLTEKELLSLLEDRAVLQCLAWDGVEDWMWYMATRDDFIAVALGIDPSVVIEQDLGFEDVARKNLELYNRGD